MIKKEFYSIYEEEHQKTKKAVDEWDCSSILDVLSKHIDSVEFCDFECNDVIGEAYKEVKNNILDVLLRFKSILDSYNKNVYDGYLKLYNCYENLYNFNNNLQSAYNKKPVYSKRLEMDEQAMSDYNRRMVNWKKSVMNLTKCCVYTEDNIVVLKNFLTQINNMEVADFKCPSSPQIIQINYSDNLQFDEYGCPLFLDLGNGQFYDFSQGELPGEFNIKDRIGIDREVNVIIDKDFIFIDGVALPVYYAYDIDVNFEEYNQYISESVEYIKMIPTPILRDIVSQGTEITYMSKIEFDWSFENTWGGVYSPVDKKIQLRTDELGLTSTVVHEIGHAIDNYLSSGHVRSYSVESKSPAFTSIKDAIYLASIDDGSYNEIDYLTQIYEFYAESFSCYIINPRCLDGTLIGEFIEKTIAMA